MRESKKAIAPIIATVLLIVVALALFLIVFFWVRSFQKEAVLKFNNPIENVCNNVRFNINLAGSGPYELQLFNSGSTAIYKAKVLVTDAGSTTEAGDIPSIKPAQTETLPSSITSCDSVKVIPILLGQTKSGSTKEHACENQAQTISC